jgi:hypothetical protein
MQRWCMQAIQIFCHCCTVESKNVHHPNDVKCGRFCADRTDEDWVCYHHQISTDGSLENSKEDIELLQCQLSHSLEIIKRDSQIKVCSDNHRGCFGDSNSIDYNPLGAENIEWFSEPIQTLQSCYIALCFKNLKHFFNFLNP